MFFVGFRVSNSTFNAMAMRYSDTEGHVSFDDFVASYVKLRSMFGELRQSQFLLPP